MRGLIWIIVLFCAVGVYSTNNNTWDVWMVGLIGLVGYIFHKLGTEPAPLLLGFILGPMMEENLRRSLAALAWRLERVCHASAVGRSAGCRCPAAHHRAAACREEQARRGLRRRLTQRPDPAARDPAASTTAPSGAVVFGKMVRQNGATPGRQWRTEDRMPSPRCSTA